MGPARDGASRARRQRVEICRVVDVGPQFAGEQYEAFNHGRLDMRFGTGFGACVLVVKGPCGVCSRR